MLSAIEAWENYKITNVAAATFASEHEDKSVDDEMCDLLAAISCQALIRRCLASKEVEILRQLQRDVSASVIQANWRGYAATMSYKRNVEAATKCQAFIRRRLAAKEVAIESWPVYKPADNDVEMWLAIKDWRDYGNVKLNVSHNLKAAPKRLSVKCYKCGKYGHKVLNCPADDREMLSAIMFWENYKHVDKVVTCVSSDLDMLSAIEAWENYKITNVAAATFASEHEDKSVDDEMCDLLAAISCQALIRRCLASKEVEILRQLQRDVSASVIQANWRGYAATMSYKRNVEAATKCQAFIRRRLAAKEVAIESWPVYKPADNDVEMWLAIKDWRDYGNVKLNVSHNLKAAPKRLSVKCYKCGKYGHKVLNCSADDHEMLSAIMFWQNYKAMGKDVACVSDLEMLKAIKRRENYYQIKQDHDFQMFSAMEASHEYKPTDPDSDLEMLKAIKRWRNYNQQYVNGLHATTKLVNECRALKTFSSNDLMKMDKEVLIWYKERDLFVPGVGHKSADVPGVEHKSVDDDLEMLSAIEAWSAYKTSGHCSDVEMLLAIESWSDYDHFEQDMTRGQATTKLVNLWQALKTFCAIDLLEMDVLN